MSWALKFAIKTLVFGIGAVGMVAAMSGKDAGSPQAQILSGMTSPDMVCKVTPMPTAQCHCIVEGMQGMTPMQQLELQQMDKDDPRKVALMDRLAQKCGHLAQAQ
jgi:hypothetical protein